MSKPIAAAPAANGRELDVDTLLAAFPRRRLSEIVGARSSGGSSLLIRLIARATAEGDLVALIDAAGSFDPAVAKAAGADLCLFLWVRCGGRVDTALRAADLVARCPGFAVVALDLGPDAPWRIPHATVVRLQRAAELGGGAVVLRGPRHVTGSAAALVVTATRSGTRWTGAWRPTRLAGLTSDFRIAHTRGGIGIPAAACSRIAWDAREPSPLISTPPKGSSPRLSSSPPPGIAASGGGRSAP